MALDPEKHEIDPATGFAVDKESGQLIGVTQAPVKRLTDEVDWPKWVIPHPGHVVRKQVDGAPDQVNTPAFPEHHVDRVSGGVTVLVATPEQEAVALSDPSGAAPQERENEALSTIHADPNAKPSEGEGEQKKA